MIFVDTNVFIYVVTEPVTPHDDVMKQNSMALFAAIQAGDIQATTSEVVLHEFFYSMMSSRLKRMSIIDMCELVRSLLGWAGWVFAPREKATFMRALDILESNPRLEFSDSVIAARAEALDATLATYDTRLAKAYSGPIWME